MLHRVICNEKKMKSFLFVGLHLSINRPYFLCSRLFAVLFVFVLVGCASQEIVPPPVNPETPATAHELENLRNQIARLEQIVAEKDELIKNQQIKQQNQAQTLREVNKEATQAQVKLHRLATKPGTASAIAETEVALAQLERIKIPANEHIIKIQAQHLIEAASRLYEKDQYATAMNYVSQARYLIGTLTGTERNRVNVENNIPLQLLTPIKFFTRSAAHLRNAPSNQAKVLVTLKKGAAVTAIASQGSWFRVQAHDNEGWILNTMLEQTIN